MINYPPFFFNTILCFGFQVICCCIGLFFASYRREFICGKKKSNAENDNLVD